MKFGKKEAIGVAGLTVLSTLAGNVEGQGKITPGGNLDHFPTPVSTSAEDPHQIDNVNKEGNANFMEDFNRLKAENDSLKNVNAKLINYLEHYGCLAKSLLTDGYYKECKSFFEDLPVVLSVPENSVEVVSDGNMTASEMFKVHTPYSKVDAFGKATQLVENGNSGTVCFKDEIGGLYVVRVCFSHNNRSLFVYVDEVNPLSVYPAGTPFFVSN